MEPVSSGGETMYDGFFNNSQCYSSFILKVQGFMHAQPLYSCVVDVSAYFGLTTDKGREEFNKRQLLKFSVEILE